MSDKEKILVADNDKFNLTLMREMCESAGYQVAVAHDGIQTLRLVTAEKPDLLLLDVMMEGKNGFEVCSELRGQTETKDLPIIIITALDDLDSKMRGIEHGADDYITKPFRLFEVQRRIRTALDTCRYRRQLAEAQEKLQKIGDLDTPGRIGGFRQLRSGLDYEFKRAQRYQRPLSCALFHFPHYEEVLSQKGQKEAAAVISSVVIALQETLRSVDRVYRIGTDQFIVLMPETTEAGARKALDRIHGAFGEPAKASVDTIVSQAALVAFPHPTIKTAQDMLWSLNLLLKENADETEQWLITQDPATS